jgi:stress response protein YsnF
MAYTVIGFFDQPADAQQAIRDLLAAGIARERIDLSRRNTDTVEGNDSHNEERSKSIGSFFRNLFGKDSEDSKRYTHVAERTNTQITVHALSDEQARSAANILDRCGAINVNERATESGYISAKQHLSNEREEMIPGADGQIDITKQERDPGGVRVQSRIVEQPVEEHVRLREEHVSVEREKVNRPLAEHERDEAFRERTIELTEHSEVPVVNKEARVVEEVRVRKDVTIQDKTIYDSVRRTDIDVEDTRYENRRTTGTGPDISSQGP